MACINPNTPEFKAALERTGNPLVAEIEIDSLPSKDDVDNIISSQPNLKNDLENRLKDYLSSINVDVQVINNLQERLKEKGLNSDAVAVSDILHKAVFLDSEKYSTLDFAEEVATFAIEFMGAANHPEASPLIKTALNNIEKWEKYNTYYDMYKDNPIYVNNDRKIKVEILSKLIAEKIVENKSKTKKDTINKKLSTLENIINNILALFDKIWKSDFYRAVDRFLKQRGIETKGVSKINIRPFDGVINEIVDDILFNNVSKIINEKARAKKGDVIVSLKEVLDNSPEIREIYHKLNALGFMFTGSPALSMEGTVYRESNKNIHDLDWQVPKELENNWLDLIKETFPEIKYKINNKTNEAQVFTKDEKTTHSLVIKGMPVDFFIMVNPTEKKNMFGDMRWQDTFEAKLKMGRNKDIRDLIDFKTSFNDYFSNPSYVYYSLNKSETTDLMLQQETQSSKKPDQNISEKIKQFLSAIGVSVQITDQLKDSNGNPITAIAMADMLNKVIQVLEGKEDITTLPEEAAHFFVEMLGDSSPLYQEMFKQITSYKVYGEVLNTYKNSKLYRNGDGTINFNKIKKEAIGKLIMSHIITQSLEDEKPIKVLQAQTWWSKVWNKIKSVFSKAPMRDGKIDNPFAESARRILTADTTGLSSANLKDDIFLQQFETVGEAIFTRLKNDQDRIKLADEENHIYSVDGKLVYDTDSEGKKEGRSITNNIVKPWYKRMFPVDRRDDIQKMVDELKAEYGIEIHSLIDGIVKRYIDENTGLVRKVPGDPVVNSFNSDINAKLDDYIKSLIYSYPEGTRFLSEVKIYNKKKNLPGTIDLVVIQKDGVVDVLDWKSQEVSDTETELKWFKEPAYRLQLNAYVQTLFDDYGVLKFGKIRAIPIRTIFKYSKLTGRWKPTDLKGIEIGPLDPSLLPDTKNYLLPVVAKNESTGDQMLDKLIEKLNAIYETTAAKSTKDKEKKYEELSKLLSTIRTLQVKRSIDNFVAVGNFELDKYNERLNSLTINEILQAIDIVKVYSEGATYLMEQLKNLKQEINNEKDPERKAELEEKQSQFTKMALNAQYMVRKLQDKAKQLALETSTKEGISGILSQERVMDYLKRNFRGLSSLETAAAQLLNRILTRVRQYRDIEVDEKFEKLTTLRNNLTDWAQKKGIPIEKMFDGILDGTNFLNLYSEEFLEKRRQAYKKSDIAWLKENLVFTDEMKKKYIEDFKKYKEAIESDKYSSDPKVDKEKKEAKILNWIERNNPEESTIAILNSKNRYLKPKDINWSDKYKDLLKPENAPLKEVYDYFQSLLLDSQKAGMIDYEFGFLPSMHKTKLEALVFGDFKNLGSSSNLLSSLSVDSANVFGKIDPINGEPILDIPVYFTKELGEEKSLDLFKVFGVWAAQTANYKAMSSIEETAKVILFVERNKGSLQTNEYGNVKENDTIINANDINANILEKHINYHIYGRKIDLSEDKVVNIFGKQISLSKGLQKIMHYYSMNVLALNPISGTASLFGGTVNAAFLASKGAYFSDKDWASGLIDYSSKDKMSHAFLDFISPELEDTLYRRTRQLSVSQAVQKVNAEDLFAFQRYSDKMVVNPVALAMYNSHMLDENNKIVYIPDYVKSKNNYENFYNLSSSERSILQNKMNKEIEELKKTKSLKALSKIENDKLVIEGLDRNSDEVFKFRAKIKKVNKKIIGNSTQEDINNIRIGILGQAFMQFRSWIPEMVTERFGDLAYDAELETYNYGKIRAFAKHLLDKRAFPLILELVTGFGDNTIEKAKERYREMIQRKRLEGDTSFADRMSESQFIDMYIGNLRSSMRELLLIMSFFILIVSLAGGDDDDKKKEGSEKFVNRLLDKYFNELAFFYSPSETKQLIKSPLPLIGFLDNLGNFFKHSFGQTMGFVLSDEEAQKESYPAKYFLKAFPIAKVGVDIGAMFDDEFRKSFGIK